MVVVAVAVMMAAGPAGADRQRIAPGTALQSEVVINTGANGLCQTAAQGDDIQAALVGFGTAFQEEVRCGMDGIASTLAAGDDRQLVAVGGDCQNRNTIVIDTGPDGIANTAAAPDDEQLIAVGSAAPNTPCVVAGANGLANTPDPVVGDDVRLIPFGTALPNAPVIRCGVNRVAETRANNVNPAGDDVQLLAPGTPCQNANTDVVDSGLDGIADTRAEGSDLLLRLASRTTPQRLTIRRKRGTVGRRIKVAVFNVEFGAAAPGVRPYQLVVNERNCPNGSVTEIDAHAGIGGLQATADVAKGGRVKASFLITFDLQDVTSVDRKIPFRCAVDVEAQSLDTAPAEDDASNPVNNGTRVEFEVVDQSDL